MYAYLCQRPSERFALFFLESVGKVSRILHTVELFRYIYQKKVQNQKKLFFENNCSGNSVDGFCKLKPFILDHFYLVKMNFKFKMFCYLDLASYGTLGSCPRQTSKDGHCYKGRPSCWRGSLLGPMVQRGTSQTSPLWWRCCCRKEISTWFHLFIGGSRGSKGRLLRSQEGGWIIRCSSKLRRRFATETCTTLGGACYNGDRMKGRHQRTLEEDAGIPVPSMRKTHCEVPDTCTGRMKAVLRFDFEVKLVVELKAVPGSSTAYQSSRDFSSA